MRFPHGVPFAPVAVASMFPDGTTRVTGLALFRRQRPLRCRLPWFRPRFVFSRWASRNVPAPLRARVGRFLGHGKKTLPSPPLELPHPVPWRRPPLFVAVRDQEKRKRLLPELSHLFSQSLWPVFWLLPQPSTKVGSLVSLHSSRGVQLRSLRGLAPAWAAPLGLVLPAEPDDTTSAATVAKHTGYPLGPSLSSLFLALGEEKRCQPAALDAELDQLFPKVSILVVTHNQPVLTEICLQSLVLCTDYPNWEVVVVDNGSDPETVRLLQEWAARLPNMRLHLNPTNRGFPAACNQGVELARGEIFCFLNNDTVVTPGWLSALVDELLTDPKVGLVGPVSAGVQNEAQVKVPDRALQALTLWAINRCQQFFRQSRPLSMLAFFCVATWRNIWMELSGLDEAFGVGLFEDDDFSLRIRRAGYRLRCRLDAYVHHFQSSSFAKLSDTRYLQIYEHNRKLFLEKKRGMRKRQ